MTAVWVAVVWVAASVPIALLVGRVIRRADEREGTIDDDHPPQP